MLNKPYKTLLATLVLATGLSVVPASTVQAEVVHITLDDGTEADIERSEIESFIAQHYGGEVIGSKVINSDEASDDEEDEELSYENLTYPGEKYVYLKNETDSLKGFVKESDYDELLRWFYAGNGYDYDYDFRFEEDSKGVTHIIKDEYYGYRTNSMKTFKHIVVSHKANKLPNVSFSASEKKGILTVKTGNLEEAVKLHKLLVSKKYKELRIKASSYKKADKILDKLGANLGIANTYGLNLMFINVDDLFDIDKKGSYYYYNYFGTTKSGLRRSAKEMNSTYYYAMKVMKRVWDTYKTCFKSHGYELPSDAHFCDLSEAARVYAVPLIIHRVHHYDYTLCDYIEHTITLNKYTNYKKKHPEENPPEGLSFWRILAGNKQYTDYVCMHFARAAESLGASLGLDVEYRDSEKLNHAWAKCKVKDCFGKTVILRSDNGSRFVDYYEDGDDYDYDYNHGYDLFELNMLDCIGLEAELLRL